MIFERFADASFTVELMARLAAWAAALQTIELLRLRAHFGPTGLWDWRVLRAEYAWPRVPDAVLAEPRFTVLLLTRLALAVGLALTMQAGFAIGLFASTYLVALRFRGSYNGASDHLSLIVQAAVAIAFAAGAESTVARYAMVIVAAQVALSYFVAGVLKLRSAAWRDGTALTAIAQASDYPVASRARAGLRNARLACAGAWMLVAFECAFPLALFDVRAAMALLLGGVAFHAVNAWALGLNHFLWTWLAAYPAVLYAASL